MRFFYLVLLSMIATSLEAQTHRVWLDVSNGPSITKGDLFVAGPGISVGWTTRNDRPLKVKISYHCALKILSSFAQQTGDLNFMTGVIWPRERSTFEFYYGLGAIGGIRDREREDVSRGSPGWGFGLPPSPEKDEFITVGIPLEVRLQGRRFGIGADANLNLHLPYFGLKVFTRIGLKE
jgi:hypothetical protein